MKPLRVEVWSDIACPWCWIGKRHLEQALTGFSGAVEVVWRAFELDPSAPRNPEHAGDLVARLARKYRVPPPQAQAMVDRMTAIGATKGIPFRFDLVRPTSTFDAHRLVHWASRRGKGNDAKERLFRAYFHEGRPVSDRAVLTELAIEIGLDGEAAEAMLAGDDGAAHVRADEAMAAELGISGVPFFVFERRTASSGAQPPEVLRDALERVRAELATDEPVLAGAACGPDGCDDP